MARTTPIMSAFVDGEWTPRLDGRVDLKGYFKSVSELRNMVVWPHGPVSKRQGSCYIAETKDSSKASRLIPFEHSQDTTYQLEFGHNYIRFFTDGSLVMDGGSPYEVVTVYGSTEIWDIKVAQIADTMYLVHPDHPVQKLVRESAVSWTITDAPLVWGPFLAENEGTTTITPSAVTGNGITLTASADLFDSDHVGAQWKISGDETTQSDLSAASATTSALTIDAGESIIVSLSGTWVGTVTLQRTFDGGSTWLDYVAWTGNTSYEAVSLEDDISFRIIFTSRTSGTCVARLSKPNQSGYVEITGYTSATVLTANVIEDLPSTNATTKWSEGAFSVHRGYPRAIRFYEQRLLLGGTFYRPLTVWGSQVDDYENMDEEIGSDDDAYVYTLAGAEINLIQWMVDGKILNVGTVGGEWKFGFTDEPTTPSNVDAKRESPYGSSTVQALLIDNTCVFVQKGGRKIRSIAYEFKSDSYKATEISAKAEHLFVDGIVDMAFQAQPDPTIWFVRSDGWLVGCTYAPDMEVIGFHRHYFSGSVESVSVNHGDDRDEVWLIVARTINGSTTRYVEQISTPTWENLEDAIFLDSSITYSGASASTITGLGHLEGEEVSVLANGAVHPNRTVESGQIELLYQAEKVQVGLGYTGLVKLQRIEAGTQAGTSQGKKKQLYKVIVRLYNTMNLKIGADEDNLDVVPFRKASMAMDAPPELFTGDTPEISFPGRGTKDGYMYFVNDTPTPFTLVAVMPTIYASDF